MHPLAFLFQATDLCVLARLRLIEYYLLHERSNISQIWQLINLVHGSLKQSPTNLLSYKFILLALVYNYFYAANDEEQTCHKAEEINFHLNFELMPDDMKVQLSRDVLRLRNFKHLYVSSMCSTVSVSEGKDTLSCVMANVFFASAQMYLIDGKYALAKTNYDKCWQIYDSELGKNHILTLEAKFERGRIRIAMGDRSTCLDETGMLWMSESIEAMRKIGNGISENLSDALIVYAGFFSDVGNFLQAEKYFKEALEILTKVWRKPNHANVLTVRHMLGYLYYSYKKWKLAIAECILVSSGLSKETHSKFSVMAAEAMCYAGYSYLKLGNISCAQKMLHNSTECLLDVEKRDTWPELLYVLAHSAVFHFSGSKNIVKAEEDFKASFNTFGMMQRQASGCVEPEVYFLLAFLLEHLENKGDLARKMYEKGLNWAKKRYIMHPSICDGFLAIAKLDLKENSVSECEQNLQQGLKMAIQIYGGADVNIEPFVEVFSQLTLKKQLADDLHNSFYSYKDKLLALGCLEESEAFASFTFDVASAIFNSDPIEGKSTRCLNLLTKAFTLFDEILGAKHFKTAECQRFIGLCYLKLGDIKKAEWNLFKSAISLLQ